MSEFYDLNDLVKSCPELEQAIMHCALCDKVKQTTPLAIIEQPWLECCGKKMDVLPIERGEREKQHRPTLYFRGVHKRVKC